VGFHLYEIDKLDFRLCKMMKILISKNYSNLMLHVLPAYVLLFCYFPYMLPFVPIRKENKVALQQAGMRMVRWMCGFKLQDRVPTFK